MAENNTNLAIPHSYFVNSFWAPFLNYVKYIKEKSGTNDIDLDYEIKNEVTELTKFLTHCAPTRSNFFRLRAQKYFSKNYKALYETYRALIDASKKDPDYLNKFNVYKYSFNKDSFRTQFLAELLVETRVLKPGLEEGSSAEFNALNYYLNDSGKLLEKKLKESYVQLLVRLGEFLSNFNLTEKYSNTFRQMLLSYSLQDLSYPAHDETTSCISIDKLFTEEYLKKLKLPKLISLSAFWINRVAKDLIKLNEILFIVNELNLWDDVKSNKKYLNIDDKLLTAILSKTKFLTSLESSIFDKITDFQHSNPNLDPEEINNIFNNAFDQAVENSTVKYKLRFDKLLPNSNNNLNEDLSALHEITNAQYLLYGLKDTSMFNLLMGAIDEHYSKNWGIILDSEGTKKFANIGMDIEGLNMPLRLHLPMDELTNFLKLYTGKPIIPLYKGYNDMVIQNTYITTSVLAPLCRKQTDVINEKLSDTTKLPQDVVNFLRHIKFLKNNSHAPAAFKSANPNAPNAINLETGEKLNIPTKEMFR